MCSGKQKKIRQADLGKLVGTSGDIIGKYKRGENSPSIDGAAKITDALGVPLNYLLGMGNMTTWIRDIQKLSDENK